MPSSSASSRSRAARGDSPGSSFPPGNSQYPAYTLPGGRCASSTPPSGRSTTAAATRTTAGTLIGSPALTPGELRRAGVALGELPRHATAARATLQCPLQGIAGAGLGVAGGL